MSAHRRLLDLLAGWNQFTERSASAATSADVTPQEYRREAVAIAALYQEAGRRDLTDAEVEAFVRDRVMPMLKKGAE